MRRFASKISKIFWGLCPQTPIPGRGYGAPPQTLSPYRSGASHLPCLVRDLRPLHRPPTRNPESTLGRTHPLKILATSMRANNLPYKVGSSLPKKIGDQTPAASPSQKSWIRHWLQDVENGVVWGGYRSHPSLSAMSPFDRAHTTSYSSLIETTSIL